MESKLKNVESKSYNKGKVNAQLWKAELNTKGKIQRKLNEARKAYKNYILEYHLNNWKKNETIKDNINNYLGFIDELERWLGI